MAGRAIARKAAGAAASLAIHGALLIALLIATRHLVEVARIDNVMVELVPADLVLPQFKGRHARPRPAVQPAPSVKARIADKVQSPAATAVAATAPVLPAETGQPAPSPMTGTAPAEVGAGVRQVLRAHVGCAERDLVGLNRREREACDERLGHEARLAIQGQAPRAMIPLDKRAFYEASARAYAPGGPAVPTHPASDFEVDTRSTPGHAASFGCGVPLPGQGKLKRPPRPRGVFKLGPLPCYLGLPVGPLTPEADLPPYP